MRIVLLSFLFVVTATFGQERIEKNLGDFNEVKVYRGLEVELIAADSPKVVIDGDKSSEVVIKNNNGLLKITMKLEGTFSSEDVEVRLYYKDPIRLVDGNEGSYVFSDEELKQELLEIRAQEGARMKLDVNTPDLTVVASTGGYVNLKGVAKVQHVKVHTGGIYKGASMKSENTTVTAGTGGNAEVYASKSVNAKASTAGNIEILGDPEQVTKKESTGGNIDN